MMGYYLHLALRTLRRNVILTALIIAAVGVGIGAYMTVLTVLIAMSGNPIPEKSGQLFVPQIDVWGPNTRPKGAAGPTRLPNQFTYRDASAFMQAHAAKRQAAMYAVQLDVTPPSGAPYSQQGRATYRDFFEMFQVPFKAGAAWSTQDETDRADVVVLGSTLAARLFPHASPVGQTVSLEGRLYRVTGVLRPWSPMPRFYDVSGNPFGPGEQFFIPFTTAIGHEMQSNGNYNCAVLPASGWNGKLAGECIWIQFWAELPDAAAVRQYRQYLTNYSAEQQRLGRFHWPPVVRLSDVTQWLALEHIVPDEVRVNSLLAFGFLAVCLVNAVGLMLARFSARASEFGVRRALGATRTDIFLQCLTETAVVGVLGGVLGLALTALGLAANRASLGSELAEYTNRLTHLDPAVMALTVALAVGATLCSGLYPTWRATRVQPAWQLKAQ